eukprot:TRINITY_DN8658_c0_g4_i1.p1 TRINITY_DN8658_c0_g4~~TRINITY_DN8658_c0_g4_i1.p1  ORF type:complete len:591 (-),score=100.45 TRINITY_DN8658_c0_g4_i1:199-1971(-)
MFKGTMGRTAAAPRQTEKPDDSCTTSSAAPSTVAAVDLSPPLLLAFIGNPSAGKSTMLNALAGRRLCQTGMSRTTLTPTLVGSANRFGFYPERFKECQFRSDDGVAFDVLDLPGIADAEDTKREFDDITEAWAPQADVIFWVSDAATAFTSRHEKSEFDKLLDMLKRNSIDTGTHYDVAIILSKFNEPASTSADAAPVVTPAAPAPTLSTVAASPDEIGFDDPPDTAAEETSYWEAYDRVVRMYPPSASEPLPPVKVLRFNAHGRILNTPGMSGPLVQVVRQVTAHAFPSHKRFELRWVTARLTDRRMTARLSAWQHQWGKYRDAWLKAQQGQTNKVFLAGRAFQGSVGWRSDNLSHTHTCALALRCSYCQSYTAGSIPNLTTTAAVQCPTCTLRGTVHVSECCCGDELRAFEAWSAVLDKAVGTPCPHGCGHNTFGRTRDCAACKDASRPSCDATAVAARCTAIILGEPRAQTTQDALWKAVFTPTVVPVPAAQQGHYYSRQLRQQQLMRQQMYPFFQQEQQQQQQQPPMAQEADPSAGGQQEVQHEVPQSAPQEEAQHADQTQAHQQGVESHEKEPETVEATQGADGQ